MSEHAVSNELDGQVALVTGGSRGIGRAVCVALASRGAHVYVNFRSGQEAAEETVKLCERAGGSGQPIGFNVGNSEEVDQAFAQLKSEKNRIDVLVNNAGISKDGLFVRMKDEDWHATLNINLNGAFYVARAAAKMMMKARSGRIINVSSVVGEMGNPGQAPYVSSKAGLIGLTKSLARELASRGITCNAITPGFIETDMTDALNEKQKAEHLAAIPLARYGKPEEIAQLVGFLSGNQSAYITGQVIGINGGLYM